MERLWAVDWQERMSRTADYAELRQLRDSMHQSVPAHLLFHNPEAYDCMVNEMHDMLIRHAVRLSERQLLEEGAGSPPSPYALMLFGSGGRREQTLWSDQDNGLIYEDAEDEESASQRAAYFQLLAERLLGGLEAVGYPPCDGNVLCSNSRWRKPLSEWLSMLRSWFDDPNWENVRYLLILADARCISGSMELAGGLKTAFIQETFQREGVLQSMLNNTLHHKVVLGVFGQLIKERYGEEAGSVDIKYGGYIPMVNGIRLLAIEAGAGDATSTLDRIEAIRSKGEIPGELLDEWRRAFVNALHWRSMTPYQMTDGYYASSGKIKAGELDSGRIREIKAFFRSALELQRYVRKRYE